jgi:type II secretory pathway component PulF
VSTSPLSSGGISIDGLVALTDEMAALARAGVPFESGLADAARDLASRPGEVAAAMSERLKRGESLQQVIDGSPDIFPPAYRAVVDAGIRAGRLPAALEGLAESSQRTAELRRAIRASMIYPVVIALIAYLMFVLALVRFQPLVSATYKSLEVPSSRFNQAMVALGQSAHIWAPATAVVALALIGFWWYRSGRAGAGNGPLQNLSPLRRVRQCGRIATFADVLALLIEHRVPLDQSIALAADASGDPTLSRAAHGLVEQLNRGTTGPALRENLSGFPPLLGWLLATASQFPGTLVEALRGTAEAYRRRAIRLDLWLRMYLPMILTVTIGGTAVVLYALSVFIPWYGMLHEAAFAK